MNKNSKSYIIGLFSLAGVVFALFASIFLVGVIHDIVFDFFNIPYQKVAENSIFNSFFSGLTSVSFLLAASSILLFLFMAGFSIHINLPKIGEFAMSTVNKLKSK